MRARNQFDAMKSVSAIYLLIELILFVGFSVIYFVVDDARIWLIVFLVCVALITFYALTLGRRIR